MPLLPLCRCPQFLLGRKVRADHPLSLEEQRALFTAPVRVSRKSKSNDGGTIAGANAAHGHAAADGDGDGPAQQQMHGEGNAAAGAALEFGLPLLPHPAQMAVGAQLNGAAGDGPAPMEF